MSNPYGYVREIKSAAMQKEIANSSSMAPTAYKTGDRSGSSSSESKVEHQDKNHDRKGF